MSEVALHIGGRIYRVACAAGEEDRVSRLGATIAEKLDSLGNPSGPDAQNLLFAALLLADEVQESRDRSGDAGRDDQLKAKISELEPEMVRLQDAAQSAADELEAARAAQTELTDAVAAHASDAENLRTEIAGLRQKLAAKPVATPAVDDVQAMAALAPALERFAEMLEECADKLESRAADA